ncbi:MAG: cytochrome c oxidase accessory protein CcoG [Bacteroidales bacterium]|nr:cytochrome c oxidase accessory protein CcoG [Bacteroidales bacterium]
MENFDDQETFRDRLSTISEEGKRLWVYPKKPKGKYYNKRTVIAILLQIFLFLSPFIKIKGDPMLLFNILERKFIIFGVIFWPQDFHLFVLSMLTFIVFIVLFTVVYGRLFCGWVCPQTVFMEFLYRPIEYLIEGNNSQQRKLDLQDWDLTKIWKKSLKHSLFFLISVLTSITFLAYIIGMDRVLEIISEGPASNIAGYLGLLAFAAAHYFVFAKFREQVCIIVCPYGRLQGVLLDNNSIQVSYDYKRGEPRGKHNPLENRQEQGKGDCIECGSCEAVCPTGIDIRNGSQLECINCTACMDACDAVMDRIHKPKGLIRYASERSIADGTKLKVNVRVIFYSTVLTGLLVLIGYLFTIRTDVETTILRVQGSMYQEYDSAHYSNIYLVQVVNKTRKELPIQLILEEPKGQIIMMGDPLFVKKGEVGEANFLVVLPKSVVTSSSTHLDFRVVSEGIEIEEMKSTFVGPNSLDRHDVGDEDEKEKSDNDSH